MIILNCVISRETIPFDYISQRGRCIIHRIRQCKPQLRPLHRFICILGMSRNKFCNLHSNEVEQILFPTKFRCDNPSWIKGSSQILIRKFKVEKTNLRITIHHIGRDRNLLAVNIRDGRVLSPKPSAQDQEIGSPQINPIIEPFLISVHAN